MLKMKQEQYIRIISLFVPTDPDDKLVEYICVQSTQIPYLFSICCKHGLNLDLLNLPPFHKNL